MNSSTREFQSPVLYNKHNGYKKRNFSLQHFGKLSVSSLLTKKDRTKMVKIKNLFICNHYILHCIASYEISICFIS